MGLGVFAPMLERVQELRIKTRQASQVLGVYLIRLALVGIDEPQFAGIGHQHLVAAFLEHPAHPRRVSTRLNCDAHGLLRTETPPQSLRSGTQPTAAAALRVVVAEEAINFALASLFNILFAGVTFILLGLAVASSGEYPGWLGWVVVVAGVGSVPVGLVQAYMGESIGFTRIATIIFPTTITLWVVVMSVLLWRKAGKSR
jgi:hypothetical protein